MLLLVPAAWGQTRRGGGSGGGGGRSTSGAPSGMPGAFPGITNESNESDTTPAAMKGIEYHEDTPDSILQQKVFIFHYSELFSKIMQLEHPSLDPTGAQFADRLDALNGNYYLSKGIVGQSNYAVYPTLAESIDMQLLPDYYNFYAKRPGNVNFYQTQTPYSLLGYHSSLNKDYQVSLVHTQNITKRWNVAMNYDLLCPQGIYTGSSLKNHYLDFTTNYYSRDSRYQLQAGHIWQKYSMDENGGVANDIQCWQQSNRAGVPVNLYNVGSIFNSRNTFAHQTYNTVRQFDAVREHKLITIDTTYDTVFTDTTRTVVDSISQHVAIDTTIRYDTIPVHAPHIINTGVFGLNLDRVSQYRVFSDSIWCNALGGTLFWTNDAYMDHRWLNPIKLTVGASFHSYDYGMAALAREAQFNVIETFSKLDLNLRFCNIVVEHRLQSNWLAPASNPSRLHARLLLPLDSTRSNLITLAATQQVENPGLLLFMIGSSDIPDQFESQRTMRFDFGYRHAENLLVDLTANNISNPFWLDEQCRLQFASTPDASDLWLLQGRITLKLQRRWFHFDMQQLVQHSTDPEVISVPLLASKNSIYADVKVFRNALHAQFGIDVRYLSSFCADAYNPAYGLFYRQNTTEVGNYYWGDIFVNLQIKRATIYAKAGHINALWEQSPNYFLLPHYPGQKFGLFFGMTWKFFD